MKHTSYGFDLFLYAGNVCMQTGLETSHHARTYNTCTCASMCKTVTMWLLVHVHVHLKNLVAWWLKETWAPQSNLEPNLWMSGYRVFDLRQATIPLRNHVPNGPHIPNTPTIVVVSPHSMSLTMRATLSLRLLSFFKGFAFN